MRNVVIMLFVVAVGAIAWLLFVAPPRPGPDNDGDYVQVAGSMAKFDDSLATVALDQLDHPPGLGIRPTDAEVPVGTLFMPGRSLSVDDESCVPQPAPRAYAAASTFPQYKASSGLAAQVGLNEGVLAALADAGATIDRGKAVTIAFEDVTRTYLNDQALKQVLQRPACQAALADGPVSMIRGYFAGRRAFEVTTTNTGGLRAGLKIAKFDVSRSQGTASARLSDTVNHGFLQLYTEVHASPVASATAAATPAAGEIVVPDKGLKMNAGIAIRLTPPAQIASSGHVYVQRDAGDASGRADRLVAALRGAGFPVAAKVEMVPSDRMPTKAQVRYFNIADRDTAERALGLLRADFADAGLLRFPLPSPPGQLEIWLPRATPRRALVTPAAMTAKPWLKPLLASPH